MIQSAAKKFLDREKAFRRDLREFGNHFASKVFVHWIDLLLLFEEALLIVVVLRLAWPQVRPQMFSVGQQPVRDKDQHQGRRAA
jgi:hypothetical protein